MGRASRRKRETKVLLTPDPVTGVVQQVSKPDGSVTYQARKRSLPAKVNGKHRMIVTVMYSVSMDSLNAAQNGESQLLDMENIVDYMTGCWDCEQPHQWCVLNPICPGDPSGRTHS